MGYRFLWRIEEGLDNPAPYHLKVLQIIREPVISAVPERIENAELQNSKFAMADDNIIQPIDLAILTGNDYNFWNGKLIRPWEIPQGASISLWLDNNTNVIHLLSEVLQEKPTIKKVSRFMTFELTLGQQTRISFPERVLLHRLIFYDLFEYDAVNLYWRPQRYTWATLINAATTNAWLEQTIKIDAEFADRYPYNMVTNIKKACLLTLDSPHNTSNIIDVDSVLDANDTIYVDLQGNTLIDWSRFKFLVIAEYSKI